MIAQNTSPVFMQKSRKLFFVHYGENLPLFLCIMEKFNFYVLHRNKPKIL